MFPISNWTELDVWQYIAREGLELPSIYYAHSREIVRRNGLLVPVTPLTPMREGETSEMALVRFRTVGDISCTCPVESDADELGHGVELVTGYPAVTAERLEGTSGTLAGEWLVKATPGTKIVVDLVTDNAGRDQKSITAGTAGKGV